MAAAANRWQDEWQPGGSALGVQCNSFGLVRKGFSRMVSILLYSKRGFYNYSIGPIGPIGVNSASSIHVFAAAGAASL